MQFFAFARSAFAIAAFDTRAAAARPINTKRFIILSKKSARHCSAKSTQNCWKTKTMPASEPLSSMQQRRRQDER
ncbi:hypothetical protein [Noviherbaspirillum galbum]|uniref:Uncharacterized protein n=1 Tax=Noviherbaspirillum galbum TaxID=2709383 RepID=A0A6B3SW64_9BURK|nr:hypothetical protein [Noviherbaspirillum galbum]NEX61909.1 hypothetical protein [Noviherbaspirillum galbum]